MSLHFKLNGIKVILRILTQFFEIISNLCNSLLKSNDIVCISRFITQSRLNRLCSQTTCDQFLPSSPCSSNRCTCLSCDVMSNIHRPTSNQQLIHHIIHVEQMDHIRDDTFTLQVSRKCVFVNVISDVETCLNLEIIVDGI